MQKQEFFLQRNVTRHVVEGMLETWAERNDAEVKPMGRLVRHYKTEGENMHWHIFGDRKGMGTVEVTYMPTTGKLTVLVHDNRRGTWAERAYGELAEQIKEQKDIV